MKQDQRAWIEYAITNLQYLLDHPWARRWSVIAHIRVARTAMSLTVWSIRKKGVF